MQQVPQPQQVPASMLKQVTDLAAEVGVQANADGSRALVLTTPFETIIFPMTAEAAQEIGRQLSAPSVVVPQPDLANLL